MASEHPADPTADAPIPLGFLYPGHAAEDDYPRMAGMIDVPVEPIVIHTSVGEDAHRVGALLDLGSQDRLLTGCRLLSPRGCSAVMWACTSGSFVFGWEGAQRQVDDIAQSLGVPASSTSFAFARAVEALGIERVAVAATYPDDVADAFREFLAEAGTEVVSVSANDVITAAEVGTFGEERVRAIATSGDHPRAQAVLVPDTAMRTAEWVESLEASLGKVVLTANQVTMWEALRLAGALRPQEGLGRLFRTAP